MKPNTLSLILQIFQNYSTHTHVEINYSSTNTNSTLFLAKSTIIATTFKMLPMYQKKLISKFTNKTLFFYLTACLV